MLKKLLITTIGLSTSLLAIADDWVTANKVGAESQGFTYAICYYETSTFSNFPDYSFSITIKGSEFSCPYSIKYNPMTREWRK